MAISSFPSSDNFAALSNHFAAPLFILVTAAADKLLISLICVFKSHQYGLLPKKSEKKERYVLFNYAD